MFEYYAENREVFTGDRDLDNVRELNPDLQSFTTWLENHRDELKDTPGHDVVSPDRSSVIVTTSAAAHSILVSAQICWVVAAVSSDRRNLCVQTGKAGGVDTSEIDADGALTKIGSTVVPNAAGAAGIATN
ncbi:hypothetical protein E1218_31475 [Kribbella turkmenica]|uniref:Uncharacterized protein n=1 Tax=Kribbella turkmenica TaxID=2530375 RepID=A0A4R4WBB3_9ACTN|nr:hypothetical protein [Kribbella turkmenica]TDD15421.1 hypothetical protein E1218_31475 [Kribbella turkmenica]